MKCIFHSSQITICSYSLHVELSRSPPVHNFVSFSLFFSPFFLFPLFHFFHFPILIFSFFLFFLFFLFFFFSFFPFFPFFSFFSLLLLACVAKLCSCVKRKSISFFSFLLHFFHFSSFFLFFIFSFHLKTLPLTCSKNQAYGQNIGSRNSPKYKYHSSCISGITLIHLSIVQLVVQLQ